MTMIESGAAPVARSGSRRRISGRSADLTTIHGRLKHRRKQLNLSQVQVAERIKFYNDKQREWVVLSRSAYCMYELGSVVPDVEKLLQIAEILRTSVEWILTGRGEAPSLSMIDYDPETGAWSKRDDHAFGERLIRDVCGRDPGEICLFEVADHTDTLEPGDIALVARGDVPQVQSHEFVYAWRARARVGQVTRPGNGAGYRLYQADRSYELVPAEEVIVLGQVVGRLGGMSR